MGLLCFFLNASAQVEELTLDEQSYLDSITALNLENEATANSQEAYNRGIALFQKKDYKGAISAFETSIKYDQNFTAAHYNKGVAENEIQKFGDAVKTLTYLIELKPSYSKAYFQRGRAHQGKNDFLNAEIDYEKAIELDVTNPKAYYNYGTLKFLSLIHI